MKNEQCISCGRDDRPLAPVENAFLNDHKICAVCASKYSHIKDSVAAEADRIMVEVEIDPDCTCMNCGCPVLISPSGQVPLYCKDCAGSIYRSFKGFLN